MTESHPRRLAAIMFTDMVGYSALAQKDEELAQQLLEEHRQLLRPLFSNHSGREVKTTGDGFLVEFASAMEAVRCAIDLQGTLATHNAPATEERRIQIRIGIHLGEIEEHEGDVYGDGVNIAARLEPLAEPGGICVSEDVARQARKKLRVPLVSLGRPELKNIEDQIEVYKVVLPWEKDEASSGQSYPGLRSRRVHWLAIGLIVVAILGGAIWFISPRFGLLPPTIANPNEGKSANELKPVTEIKSIAVLPFDNTSNDPENEYFSDGMTEELISALSQVEGLRVIARTSAFMFKGKKGDVRKIGEQLNVGVVLDGSVQKAGDKLRITAHLVNARDGNELWSKSYDRELKDVFAIEDDVSQAIVNVLKVKLAGEAIKSYTVNREAHDLYLKGRYFFNKYTEEGFQKAIEYFNQAITKDPNYALEYVGLADTYNALPYFTSIPTKEAFPRAKAAALMALKLDETLAAAHSALASVRLLYDWDWVGAEREFKQALSLNPSYAMGHDAYAWELVATKQFDEAIAEQKQALELDPVNLNINADMGWVFDFARRYNEAIEQFRKTLEMDTNFWVAYQGLGYTYLAKQMSEEALMEFQREKDLLGSDPVALWDLGYVNASLGKKDEAYKLIDELKERAKQNYIPSFYIAWIYVGLGDKDQAFAWLDKAYEERSNWLTLLNVDPAYDSLRSDPRFIALLKKIGP